MLKSRGPIRKFLDIGLMITSGAIVGMLIAKLKTSFGVSPYWFVAAGTFLTVTVTSLLSWFLTSPHPAVFVLDWVMGIELLVFLALVSSVGLFSLASLVWSGIVALFVGVLIVSVAVSVVWYAISRRPDTTWDPDALSE